MYVYIYTYVYHIFIDAFLFSYKPLQMIHIVTPLKEEFEQIFRATFSLKQNARFLASVQVRVYDLDVHTDT